MRPLDQTEMSLLLSQVDLTVLVIESHELSQDEQITYVQKRVQPFLEESDLNVFDVMVTAVHINNSKLLYLALLICIEQIDYQDSRDVITALILVYNAYFEVNLAPREVFKSLEGSASGKVWEFMTSFNKRTDELMKPECVSFEKRYSPYFHFVPISIDFRRS